MYSGVGERSSTSHGPFCPLLGWHRGMTVLAAILALLTRGCSVHAATTAHTASFAAHRSLLDLSAECPLNYRRMTPEEIKNGSKPYLLGGKQQPECKNCNLDNTYGKFCQYKSHGPVCADWLQWEIQRYYRDRGPSASSLTTLTPCDLWPFLRQRTIFIVGDSQALNYWKAVKCFMVEFWDGKDDEPLTDDHAFNDAMTEGLDVGKGVHPLCSRLMEDSRVCFVRITNGNFLTEVVLPHVHRFAKRGDIIVVNWGLWVHNRVEYSQQIQQFAAFYKHFHWCLPFIFWKDSSMQHFDTPLGEYPGVHRKFNCKPIGDVVFYHQTGELHTNNTEKLSVLEGGWRNQISTPQMMELGIPIVHSWNETFDMWRYHLDQGGGVECTHFCHPSAYQMWVWALYRTLVQELSTLHRHLDTQHHTTSAPACKLLASAAKFEGIKLDWLLKTHHQSSADSEAQVHELHPVLQADATLLSHVQ